jgi:hypothetical protein
MYVVVVQRSKAGSPSRLTLANISGNGDQVAPGFVLSQAPEIRGGKGEALLDGVLCVVRIAEFAQADPVQTALVPVIEVDEEIDRSGIDRPATPARVVSPSTRLHRPTFLGR